MNGFLIANKPTGITSSNLVVFVRKRLPRGTSVGHGGTLDPEASGVLPVCIGSATRLFDYIIDKKKTYIAELQLGVVTDTQDATGSIVEEHPVTATEAELRAVVKDFVGEIEQIPPMYSAIKRGGKRLYQMARKGETIEVEPRKCRVDGVEVLDKTGENKYRIRVDCGKGVYIRTLCHDIGAKLGCGGHMASLERVAAGIFALEDALTREEIDAAYNEGTLAEKLIPLDAPLGHLPELRLTEEARHAVINGNVLKRKWMKADAPRAESVRIYLGDVFAGIGQTQLDGTVRFKAMLLPEEEKHANLQK
ncbi:MAG: tRNA pseudouridine(55) synthase TruB [Clostridia bacterium]|nr:tRNA pseudouridine(55) synthase TruB [Clostridia bacterium]